MTGARPTKSIVRIRKEAPETYPSVPDMWIGKCNLCPRTWQYWEYGATLGVALIHIWKEHRG